MNLVVLSCGTEGDEVELDTVREPHDALDDLDGVLCKTVNAANRQSFVEQRETLTWGPTHIEQPTLDLPVVDGAVPSSVELDEEFLVLDEGDKVQVGIVLKSGSLREGRMNEMSSPFCTQPCRHSLSWRSWKAIRGDSQPSVPSAPPARAPVPARSRWSEAGRARAGSAKRVRQRDALQ